MATLELPRFMRLSRGRQGCWRWEVGGARREALEKAGFKSRDLKDNADAWLPFEQARAEAVRLNGLVDRWSAGEDLETASIATRLVTSGGRLTVAHMIAAWQASESWASDAAETRRGRASCLRAVAAAFGDVDPASVTRGLALGFYAAMLDFAHWRAATPIGHNAATRVAPKFAHYLALPKDVRRAQHERRLEAMEDMDGQPPGAAMAFHACAAGRTLWSWCADNLDGFTAVNPFLKLGLQAPAGRVRRITDAELAVIDQAAIDIGMPDLGDAFALGVLTCQRRADLCRLTWDIRRTGRVQLTQQKTGVVIDFRAPAALMERLEAIWQRHRAQGVKRMDRILINRYGKAYDEPEELTRYLGRLRNRCVEIQRKEGQPVTLDDVVLHDSRDTGVIIRFEAHMDTARVSEHSGHSLRQLDLIKKSYLGRNKILADQATDMLDAAWRAAQGGKG